MKALVKPAAILGIAGALMLGVMAPSEARGIRPFVAAGIGLAAGAAIAGAASGGYYNGGYYDGGYYNGGYAPGYGAYAYEPAPVYSGPAYGYPAPAYSYGAPSYSSDSRYSPYYNGYNSNYTGPLRERTLQGRDY